MNSEQKSPEAMLEELGIRLPSPAAPVASYIPARRVGDLVFISGQIPLRDGEPVATGKVPTSVSIDLALDCARQCVLNALAALRAETGSLDRVEAVVRLGCFIASEPGFADHPTVANGASELIQSIFGDRGRHARAAVGCPSLPLNVPVEIEFLFQLRA